MIQQLLQRPSLKSPACSCVSITLPGSSRKGGSRHPASGCETSRSRLHSVSISTAYAKAIRANPANGLTQTNALRSASCLPGKLCLAGFNHPSVPPVAAFDPDNRAVEQASGLEDDRIVVGTTPTHQQNPLTFA